MINENRFSSFVRSKSAQSFSLQKTQFRPLLFTFFISLLQNCIYILKQGDINFKIHKIYLLYEEVSVET
jgi:hypothetical protein